MSKANSCHEAYRVDNAREAATIGPTSPTVPAASSIRPNGVPSCPPSRRIGNSVPSPVVANAMTTINGATAPPMRLIAPIAKAPIAIVVTHPIAASCSGRPRMSAKSISIPAMKSTATIPTSCMNARNRS